MFSLCMVIITSCAIYFVYQDVKKRRVAAFERKRAEFAQKMTRWIDGKQVEFKAAFEKVFRSEQELESRVSEFAKEKGIEAANARFAVSQDIIVEWAKDQMVSINSISDAADVVRALALHMEPAQKVEPTLFAILDKFVTDRLAAKGLTTEKYKKARREQDASLLIEASLMAQEARRFGYADFAEWQDRRLQAMLNNEPVNLAAMGTSDKMEEAASGLR